MKNIRTKENIYAQMCRCIFGLFIFSFGLYMTVVADIGLAPWDVLAMGLSYHTPLTYGNALIAISILVLFGVFLLREKIGFGTIFDAILVGLFVDLFTWLDLISRDFSMIESVAVFICGMFIIALGQYFYMSSCQGCGPRDTLLIGLGKRMKKVPIGVVNTLILCVVLAGGWLLDGPVGIGTLLAAFGLGTALQFVCKIFRFEPRDIVHKNVFEALRIMKEKA